MLGHRSAESVANRVGLDIGSHAVKGVEIVERGAETVVRSAGSMTVPVANDRQNAADPGAVAHAIRGLWCRAAFTSNKVVVALPPESVYLKWLHLEAPDEDQLGQTARAAAARGAPFPASDAIVDYRVLFSRGAAARGMRFVMLVAASASAVDGLLNIVESAGLEPLAVDVGAAAVLRCFETHRRTSGSLWSGQPLAHCTIGARSTTITVVRGGALEFARTVPVGGNDFTQCVVDATGLSWPEAESVKTTPGSRLVEGGVLVSSHNGEQLRVSCESAAGRLARETLRSLRFFRSQFAEGSYLGMTGAATLSGGGGLLKGIDACLQEQGIDITSVINPFAGLSVAAEGSGIQHVGDNAAAYTTAVGLALGDYWSADSHTRQAAA